MGTLCDMLAFHEGKIILPISLQDFINIITTTMLIVQFFETMVLSQRVTACFDPGALIRCDVKTEVQHLTHEFHR